MRFSKWIFVSIIFLTLLLPAFLSLGIKEIPGDSQPSLDYAKTIGRVEETSQSFIANYNNLSAVGMTIKNPNLANKGDFILRLFQDGKELRVVTLNGRNIPGGDFIKFRFSPVKDSLGRQFSFSLTTTSPETHDLFEIYYSKTSLSDGQKLLIDAKDISGSVSFVSFYQPNTRFALIKDIYSGWVNRLFADRAFVVGYLLLLGIGLIALVINKRFK